MSPTRGVLMQCPGDPFVAAYWFRNLERVWRGTFGELRVFVNGQDRPEVLDFLRGETERLGGAFTHQPGRLIHGQATRELVLAAESDVLMLIEDDAFVISPAVVDLAFRMVEEGHADVVATPRGGMSPFLEQAATEKWGQFGIENGGNGPGLWPCFFWARRDLLLHTSLRFESWSWQPGDVIPGLDYAVGPEGAHTDTMTAVAFELRGMGARIEPCVQHKELWHKKYPEQGAPWFHAGGLSCGRFLDGWHGDSAREGVESNEAKDWAHRIWWWRRCAETAPPELEHLRDVYLHNLGQLAQFLGPECEREVEAWETDCLDWIRWDDGA